MTKEFLNKFFVYTGFGFLLLIFGIYFLSTPTREIYHRFNRVNIRFKVGGQFRQILFSVVQGGEKRYYLRNRYLSPDEGVVFLLFPPQKIFVDSALLAEDIDVLILDNQGKVLETRTVMACRKRPLCTRDLMGNKAYYVVALKAGVVQQMGFTPGRVLPFPEVLPVPDYENELDFILRNTFLDLN